MQIISNPLINLLEKTNDALIKYPDIEEVTLELCEIFTDSFVGIQIIARDNNNVIEQVVWEEVRNYIEEEKAFKTLLEECNIAISQILISLYEELMKKLDEHKHRATGRTTRLADYFIQELFKNPGVFITITDHSDNKQSNDILTNLIQSRLFNEHKNIRLQRQNNSLKIILNDSTWS